MIIDFHTHIFPDDLAGRALATLVSRIRGLYTPVSDGTRAGLLRRMDEWGVDISVIQPVVTKPSQTKNTNLWAAENASRRIIPFGSIFPDTDDYKRDIDFAAGLGLKGLKFHAEYQEFVVDDKKMLKIYDYALSRGLILLHHAGFDPAYAAPFRSSPRQFANIADAMRGGVMVCAHLGGHAQWDEVERYLVGKNVYLDTSMGLDYYSHEQFLRIIRGHGAERILFASDSPWSSAGKELETLRSLPLTREERERILGGNARRLLGV